MRLKKIKIQNFRRLENCEINLDPQVTVLFGANSTGKSSIIDSISFLHDASFLPTIEHLFEKRGGFSEFVYHRDSKREISIELELSGTQSEFYSYSLTIGAHGIVQEEYVGPDLKKSTKRTSDNMLEICINDKSVFQKSSSLSDALFSNEPQLDLFKKFLLSTVVIDPFRNINPINNIAVKEKLSPSGEDLPRVLHSCHNNNPEKYEKYLNFLKKVLPEIDRVKTPLREKETRQPGVMYVPSFPSSDPPTLITSVSVKFKNDPTDYGFMSLSSGIKEIMVLIAALTFSDGGTLHLLEEPENHLHPGAQKALCSLIQELAQTEDKQFVITTHSDSIIRYFKEELCHYVDIFDSHTRITRLDQVDIKQAMESLGINEIRLFEILGRKKQILLVTEGRDDAKIMEALIKDDAELNASVIVARADGGGWEELITSGSQLRDSLKRFRVPSVVFILLDNDGKRSEKSDFLIDKGFDDKISHVWTEKELESYLIEEGPLASISGNSIPTVQKIISKSKGNGKEKLEWVLKELGIDETKPSVIAANMCSTKKLPQEFATLLNKLRSLL